MRGVIDLYGRNAMTMLTSELKDVLGLLALRQKCVIKRNVAFMMVSSSKHGGRYEALETKSIN